MVNTGGRGAVHHGGTPVEEVKMICPLMSKPVVGESPVGAGDEMDIYLQDCLKEDCAWWIVLVDTKRSQEENTQGMEKGCCAVKLLARR